MSLMSRGRWSRGRRRWNDLWWDYATRRWRILWRDYQPQHPCERCGAPTYENHHFCSRACLYDYRAEVHRLGDRMVELLTDLIESGDYWVNAVDVADAYIRWEGLKTPLRSVQYRQKRVDELERMHT